MNTLTPYQQKAIDFSKHISLTANAGSGKTFVLANRFVEIAVNQDIPLNSIIAITFTDKAAGELYKKISEEIDNRLLNEKNSITLKKLEEIRRRLVSANISTIHSFCINVLKEFSPEAGIDASFLPADANTADELLELSVEELFKADKQTGELNDGIKELTRYFGSKTLASEKIKYLVKNRKNILEVEKKIYQNNAAEIGRYFNEKFETKILHILPDINVLITAVKEINNEIKKKTVNDFTIAIDTALNAIVKTEKIADKILQLIQIEKNITTTSGIRNRNYLSKKLREGLEKEIETITDFFEEFDKLKFSDVDTSINENLALFGKLILEVFAAAHSIYEQRKKELSLLDFEDILLKAKNVLKNDFVREQLNSKYKYIMIDEYQDTNEIQYDIVMPILKYLNEGNLFIVGDEKQSIYRFRDAEPEIFRRTTSNIIENEVGGSSLNLPHSFRVSPPIAFFVNTVFKELFKNNNPDYNEVKYDELLCARKENESGQIGFLLHNEENEDETESDLLAKKILQLCKRNSADEIKFGDIAILCRKRASFPELEKVFVRNKIPYIITGGKGFFQRQSIYDIYNFVSFVLNPDDDIALLGILRSPFFLLPDTVIFEISLIRGKTFFKKLVNYSAQRKRSVKIITQLNNFIEFASTSSTGALLRKIIDETGYWSVVAAKTNAQQELANIEKLIHVANGFSLKGFRTLYDFKEYLSDAINRVEDESQAPISEDDNSVKIMTVHQSKGLEFNTVFLYKCSETTLKETVRSKDIYIDKDLGILAKIPKDENYFVEYKSAPIVSIYNYVTTRKSKAELKRLLYVAITRAQNNLFISATHKNYKFKEDTFIKLLSLGLKSNLSESLITITGKLQYMKTAAENYSTYFNDLSVKIHVTTSVNTNEAVQNNKANIQLFSKKFITEPIFDNEKEEIISATKIAYFQQCPVKYQLTYEFGYAKLMRLIRSEKREGAEDFREESDEYLPADIKGKILHSLLENEIESGNAEVSIKKLLQNEFPVLKKNQEIIGSFTNDILTLLTNYYSSAIYKKIKSYKNFKNEFEIYVKIHNYYLYGIIDKLIINDEKIVIVDYKTDKITENKIPSKVENYIPQLMFYAVIVKNIFPNVKEIKLRLIFLHQPDKSFEKNVSQKELNEFGKVIQKIIQQIRIKNFQPNKNHCIRCHIADENNNCPLKTN